MSTIPVLPKPWCRATNRPSSPTAPMTARPFARACAVADPATAQALAKGLAVIGAVGEDGLFVALHQGFGKTGIVDIGRTHLGLPHKPAVLPPPDAPCSRNGPSSASS